jgi:hypothetical protein
MIECFCCGLYVFGVEFPANLLEGNSRQSCLAARPATNHQSIGCRRAPVRLLPARLRGNRQLQIVQSAIQRLVRLARFHADWYF